MSYLFCCLGRPWCLPHPLHGSFVDFDSVFRPLSSTSCGRSGTLERRGVREGVSSPNSQSLFPEEGSLLNSVFRLLGGGPLLLGGSFLVACRLFVVAIFLLFDMLDIFYLILITLVCLIIKFYSHYLFLFLSITIVFRQYFFLVCLCNLRFLNY